MRGLSGRTAIVSGGATLIGQSVAETLAGYGTRVVIADINEEDGRAAALRLGEAVSFLKTDITRDHEIVALVTAAVEKTGRLDFLVNVASTYLDNGAETTREDWLTALDVNIVGSVMLMQAARPHLRAPKAPSSISDRSRRVSRRPGAGSIRCRRPRSCN